MDATGSGAQVMIRLSGVGKTYPDGTVAVRELDLDVPEGITAIVDGEKDLPSTAFQADPSP